MLLLEKRLEKIECSYLRKDLRKLSDITNKSAFSRDSIEIKKTLNNFLQCREKPEFFFLTFRLNSSEYRAT